MSNKEAQLLKLLGVIAFMSAVILYFVLQPQEIKTIQGAGAPKAEQKEESGGTTSSPTRSGGGGGGSRSASSSGSSDTGGIGTLSISSFEANNRENSCWVLIDGVVYDITAYLDTLSSTEDVVSYCGTFGFEAGYIDNSIPLKDAVIELSTRKGVLG